MKVINSLYPTLHVSQDDIIFAELTVKENLMFSGKFRLPVETSNSEIESITSKVLVNLGLVRVANRLVAGVSSGEKKRVNIGLELMARPSILFLDEPTSGLDSSSAMLVMKTLRTIVHCSRVSDMIFNDRCVFVDCVVGAR